MSRVETKRPDQMRIGDPDWGRWYPSYDVLPVGTPGSASSVTLDLIRNHSYYIYTTPRPYDWFVFGFACNWFGIQIVSNTITISSDEDPENLSLRPMAGSALLGWPVLQPEGGGDTVQINPHWLPLQYAYCVQDEKDGIWAWFKGQSEEYDFGVDMKAWFNKKRCRYVAPFKVSSGNQLRFILQNRFTAQIPATVVTVVGMRWLPWEGDGPAPGRK